MPKSVDFLIAYMAYDWNIHAQVFFYQVEGIVELIGDVICPNENCGVEKCVYLTSFEEINKSTYLCKKSKACSHLRNVHFKDQKSCIVSFDGT